MPTETVQEIKEALVEAFGNGAEEIKTPFLDHPALQDNYGRDLLRKLGTLGAYTSLNDASRYIEGLGEGETEIYYLDNDCRNARDISFKPESAGAYDFAETYKLLGKIKLTDLEEIFMALQGENWSPLGEANPFIRGLGLYHTSMSVGDIVIVNGKKHVVCGMGFKEVQD